MTTGKRLEKEADNNWHPTRYSSTNMKPKDRARQNVVFEHGYLIAKLERENVWTLVNGDIETPNDVNGLVYVTLDEHGA